jgi:transcriptional regulator with XRE-family HTH domain
MARPSESLIEAIKQARKKKGLTQRELSRKTKIPQSHISKVEKGVVDLHISSLEEIGKVLELEVMLIPVSLGLMVRALLEGQKSQVPMYQLKPEDGDGSDG